MEKTNINITEEIARIEKEVEQLEKELEKLEKEQEEYNKKKHQLEQNPYIAQTAKNKIDKELTNLFEKSQELQAQIKEKQEHISNLGSLILGMAYESIAKDDEMVDAIIAGYIQNINAEIEEAEKAKKEIDPEIAEYIGMIGEIGQDKSYVYCSKPISPFNNETTIEYLDEISKNGQRLDDIEKRIDDLNEKKLVPEQEYRPFKQLIEALKLGACDTQNVDTNLIWILESIDRGLVIERLNNLPYKEKLADSDILLVPNGKTIDKKTIEALKTDLIKVLEPSEEYIREMYKKSAAQEQYVGEHEFFMKTICEMQKGKILDKGMIQTPNGAMTSAEALRRWLDGISSSYQQYETPIRIQKICDKYEFEFEKIKSMQQKYTNKYIKQLIEGATKYEDILFILDLMGINASFGEIDTKYSEAYCQALRDIKVNESLEQDINGLTAKKHKLNESTPEERRKRIERTLVNPKFLEGNLVPSQYLEALKAKIDAYNGKTRELDDNKKGRERLEAIKEKLARELTEYDDDLRDALSEGETPESVEDYLVKDSNGYAYGKEVCEQCSKAFDGMDFLKEDSPAKREFEDFKSKFSDSAHYGTRTKYEKIKDLKGFEEVIDSMIQSTNDYINGNKRSIDIHDTSIAKLETEIEQLEADRKKIEKGKYTNAHDSLYRRSDGRTAVFKFFFRFTKQYKKNQKRLLNANQRELDEKNTYLNNARTQKKEYEKSVDEYTKQKQELENKKQELEQNGTLEKINKMLQKYKVLTKYMCLGEYCKKEEILERRALPDQERENQAKYDSIQAELQELHFTQEEVDRLIETYPNLALHIRNCIDNQKPLQLDLMRIVERANRMKAVETNISSEYGEDFAQAAMSGGEITTGLTQEEEMDLIQERRKAK